jgi:hypothetical protein
MKTVIAAVPVLAAITIQSQAAHKDAAKDALQSPCRDADPEAAFKRC